MKTTRTERLGRSLVIALLGSSWVTAPGCGRDDGGTGNTNWNLNCEESSECDDGLLCQCGQCSEACEGTLDCSAEPESQCMPSPSQPEAPDDASAPEAGSPGEPGDPPADDAGRGSEDSAPVPSDSGQPPVQLEQAGDDAGTTPDSELLVDDSGAPPASEADTGAAPEDPPAPAPDPSAGAELCSLPVGEWQMMAPHPEFNSLQRAVGWGQGALHYMGDGNSRTDVRTNTLNYGRFDPCSNSWQTQSFAKSTEAASVLGWDGSGFTLHPYNPYYVLNTTGLRVTGRTGLRLALGDDTLSPVSGPVTVDNVMVYTEEGAPELFPITPSYMNGATDGVRGFVWGETFPTEEDPTPTARGWILEANSNQWREISGEGAPSLRRNHAVVAADGRFVVWGGRDPDDSNAYFNDGAFYDPDTDSWESIPSEGAPEGSISIPLYWVAGRLVVRPNGFGGVFTPGQGWQSVEPPGIALPYPRTLVNEDHILVVGALSIVRFDPVTASWEDLSDVAGLITIEHGREFFDAVWTGSTLLLWGSSIPQTCDAPEGVTGCDVADPYLPAGEGIMVRLE